MIIKPSDLASSRREFLLNVLPPGALFCLGCGNLLKRRVTYCWLGNHSKRKLEP